MATPEERAPLEEALAALWSSEVHHVSVGAEWSDRLDVVWVSGHVSQFESGAFVTRAPALTARTAVALARSWLAEDRSRLAWVPEIENSADFALHVVARVDVVEVTHAAAAPSVAREPKPLNLWLGPSFELQSSLGTGFRTEVRETVGWDLELLGWLQPALVDRERRPASDGSWVAVELRTSAHLDLVPGPIELRLGPTLMASDFGVRADLDKATGGMWAGGMGRVRVPVGSFRVGGDVQYRLPVAALIPVDAIEAAMIGRLSRFAGATAMVGVPLHRSSLELGVGGSWRLDPEADHGTPSGSPLHAKLSWVVSP